MAMSFTRQSTGSFISVNEVHDAGELTVTITGDVVSYVPESGPTAGKQRYRIPVELNGEPRVVAVNAFMANHAVDAGWNSRNPGFRVRLYTETWTDPEGATRGTMRWMDA